MDFIIDLLKVIFLGIVEGITEWLPISSTGHLILFEEILGITKDTANVDFWSMFRVVIQLGAIFAVIVLYFNKLNPFSPKKSEIQKKDTWSLWFKVAVACLPAAVLGLLLDDWLDKHLYNYLTVGLMLLVYGVLFIVVENRNKNKVAITNSLKELTYQTALFIGAFQVLSLIPGTSRSGATILGAILVGCSRKVAAEFTFFLAIPVMFGASLLKVAKFGFNYTPAEIIFVLVGMIVSFIVSVIAIKFLMGYIKKNDFKAFGYYRIVLGVIVLIVALCTVIF